MGVGTALERYHTGQELSRHLGEDGGRHLVGHQHHRFADRDVLGFILHQSADEPLGYVLHISGSLLQIGVFHPLELLDQPVTDELHR